MDLSAYILYCWCSFLTSYGWVFGWFRKLFHCYYHIIECVEFLNSSSTPLCFNCFISPIVLVSTSSNQLFSGEFITTHVQIFHRCKCDYFLMILYRWNVANTFTCVLCIHSVSPSDIVSKWMGESEKQVSDLFQKAR